jgi:hypothetical protein
MIALLCFFLTLIASPFKLKSRLAAENAALRQSTGTARSRPLSGAFRKTNARREDFSV